MSYSPSPVSSHAKDAEEKYNTSAQGHENPEGSSSPDSRSVNRLKFEPHDQGFWKYVPFQYMSLRPKITNPYVTTAIACMGGLLFGFGSTNMTPFIGGEAYSKYFHPFSSIDQSGMTAAMPGGATIGSVICACVGEQIGRRGMVVFSAMIWIIGCAIQTAANNRVSLAFGRIIASIGIGSASSTVPMYLAEMVPANVRGRFTACFQFSVNVGILTMFYIGFGCSFIKSKEGEAGFRLAWGIQMVPGALMLLGSMFLHESPRWLASKGRWEECTEVLTALYKADAESDAVRAEIETFQAENEIQEGRFKDLFNKRNIKQTLCSCFTMLTQQYCGCNAILYFSTSIVKQVGGYGSVMTQVMSSIDYIVLLAATIPSVLFFDKFSRRWVMILGAFGLLLSLAVVAGIEGAAGHPVGPEGVEGDPSVRLGIDDPKKAKAALAFSYIFCGMFSLSWGPMAWVYVGEIFNQDVRALGNSFASSVCWLFNFTLSIYTQKGFETITYKTYVIFAVFSFIAIPVVFLFFPETKGYRLEQINGLFNSGIFAYKTDPVYLWMMKRLGKEVHLPEPEEEPDHRAKKIGASAEHYEKRNEVDLE